MEKKIDFLALYQRLFQTLSHGKMQELMDVSYEVTGVPILAVDIAYNLLGAVPKNKTGDYYWDYLVEHKRYDMDMTVQLYTDGIMQSVNEKEAPYIVDWGAATEEFPKILGVIKINNIVEGYVVMQCKKGAITACPISAATVGILAFMAEATNYTKVNIFTLLIVCVPATLIGTIVAAIAVIKKGKELADDPEFQARVKAGLIEDFSKKVKEEKKVSKEAKISVTIFLIAMVGIVLLGAVSGLVPTLADGSKLPLTTVIEIFMLVAAAAMILLTKLDSNKVLDQPVFRTGMFAVVLAFGLCWLVNTFIGDQSSFITDNMSALTNKYPWIFIVAVFIVGAITTSQSSTTMIMIPIGIALGLPANVIVAGWIACSSNYFIPASGQCVAALAFDSAGTTKIGKFVLNHSYMIPGLVCTVVSVVVALLIGAVVF